MYCSLLNWNSVEKIEVANIKQHTQTQTHTQIYKIIYTDTDTHTYKSLYTERHIDTHPARRETETQR